MGNCCEHRIIITDNDAENFIRESISSLKIRRFDFSEFDDIIVSEIQVSMLDINFSNLPKWITRDKYEKIINENVLNGMNNASLDNKEHMNNQRYSCLNYEDLFVLERTSLSPMGNSNFVNPFSTPTPQPTTQSSSFVYNNFLIWIIAFTKLSAKSKIDKIVSIEKIIQKTDNAVTFSAFCKFLSCYVQILLFKITENFDGSNEICDNKTLNDHYSALKTHIFNKENIDVYFNTLLDRCSIIVCGQGYKKGADISNTFMKNSHIKKFCNENSFLLDAIELRDNFYTFYTETRQYNSLKYFLN